MVRCSGGERWRAVASGGERWWRVAERASGGVDAAVPQRGYVTRWWWWRWRWRALIPISSSVFFVAADEPICERSRLIGTRILAVSAGSTAFAGRLPLALLDMSFSFGGMR